MVPPPKKIPIRLKRQLEESFEKKDWKKVRQCIDKNKDIVQSYATGGSRTLLHHCCRSNDIPLWLLRHVAKKYPTHVRKLCHSPLGLVSTPLHEGIRNELDLGKLKYLLSVDSRLPQDSRSSYFSKSVTKVLDFEGFTPLDCFLQKNSFYLSKKKAAIDFAKRLVKANPEAVYNNNNKLLLSLLSQIDSLLANNEIDEEFILELVKLIMSAYPPQLLELESASIISSIFSIKFHLRFDILRILIKSYEKSLSKSFPLLHIFVQMEAEEKEIKLVKEYGFGAATTTDHGGKTASHWAWISYVQKFDTQKPIPPSSLFSCTRKHRSARKFLQLQDACVHSTLEAIRIFKDTAEETPNFKLFQKFRSLLSILLDSPLLIVHALCSVPCPRGLLHLAILLHPEQLSVHNTDNNLPLHIALITMTNPVISAWKIDNTLQIPIMKLIFKCYPEALIRRDGILRLYPFMIAATNSNVTLTYLFLREAPYVLHPTISCIKKT